MKLKEYKYKINGIKFTVGVGDIVNNQAQVVVNGTPYTVELDENQAPKAAAIASAVKRPAAAPRTETGEKVINKVYSVCRFCIGCEESSPRHNNEFQGERRRHRECLNDTVCVLEAVKMENDIHTQNSGTVKKICVNVGDAVLEGADIMIIE